MNQTRKGRRTFFWQLANGGGELERLTTSEHINAPQSFTPDGKLLAYIEVTPDTKSDIWVVRVGDRKAQPFLRTPFNEGGARFSPDGRLLAYSSDESGRVEVYIQPYPGPGGKWQSQPMAVRSRCGTRTDESSSTATVTR